MIYPGSFTLQAWSCHFLHVCLHVGSPCFKFVFLGPYPIWFWMVPYFKGPLLTHTLLSLYVHYTIGPGISNSEASTGQSFYPLIQEQSSIYRYRYYPV